MADDVNVHFTTAATIGTDGLPLIAAYVTPGNDLRVLHCSNLFCVPNASRR